mmetsp:Transcript_43747/g.64242  ORF Transcript_43747/g.64242 Transcript_43747/m.64242 type:complete len:208 (-) Transcript_43747:217-840(-)
MNNLDFTPFVSSHDANSRCVLWSTSVIFDLAFFFFFPSSNACISTLNGIHIDVFLWPIVYRFGRDKWDSSFPSSNDCIFTLNGIHIDVFLWPIVYRFGRDKWDFAILSDILNRGSQCLDLSILNIVRMSFFLFLYLRKTTSHFRDPLRLLIRTHNDYKRWVMSIDCIIWFIIHPRFRGRPRYYPRWYVYIYFPVGPQMVARNIFYFF